MAYSKALGGEILGTHTKEQVKNAYNKLLEFDRPKNFNPDSRENILLLMDKNYSKTIFSFTENNIYNSEFFTMFEFRTAIELLKERSDKIKAEIDKLKQK